MKMELMRKALEKFKITKDVTANLIDENKDL